MDEARAVEGEQSLSLGGSEIAPEPTHEGVALGAGWRRGAMRAFEAIFLGYLLCVTASGRTFAHLHLTVGGAPLFTGELVLLALTVLAIAIHGPRGLLPRPLDFPSVALLLLLAYGGILAVRGLAASYGLAALRDYALVYYGWFFFLTRAYLRTDGTVQRILGALLVGSVAGATARATAFLVSPSLSWGHGAAGYEALYAWTAVVIVLANLGAHQRPAAKVVAVAAILICSFVIFLSGYRTMLLVIATSLAFATLLTIGIHHAWLRAFVRRTWMWALVLLATMVLARVIVPNTSRTVANNGSLRLSDALAISSYRWSSDLYGARPGSLAHQFDETGSVTFRENAWRHAVQRILSSPWGGIGFGTPAILHPASDCDTFPSPTSNCGAAHNTYLMLAMRLGIPAALLFYVILLAPLARAVAARRNQADPLWADPQFALSLVIGLSFLVFGSTSLLLESPYLSSVLWTQLAVIQPRRPK